MCPFGLADVFSISMRNEYKKQSVGMWDSQQHSFIVLPQGYVNVPTLHHYVFSRDLDHLDILRNIMLNYYINDIMLIGKYEQACILKTFKHMLSRWWDIQPMKIHEKFMDLNLFSLVTLFCPIPRWHRSQLCVRPGLGLSSAGDSDSDASNPATWAIYYVDL